MFQQVRNNPAHFPAQVPNNMKYDSAIRQRPYTIAVDLIFVTKRLVQTAVMHYA